MTVAVVMMMSDNNDSGDLHKNKDSGGASQLRVRTMVIINKIKNGCDNDKNIMIIYCALYTPG